MYKFLLVEDSHDDAEACLDTVLRMNSQLGHNEIEIVVSKTLKDAFIELKNNYHGAIVDIKLDSENDENNGNVFLKTIINECRVPVAVMTGTPDTDLNENSPIRIYTKGENTYEEIINNLIKSHSTGLFNVIGGKGIIEQVMNQVFWNNLYPQIHIWETLKDRGYDVERILLRYAISHIHELIDADLPAYVTEEMYIKPPINKNIRTGSIIKAKKDNLYCIVLSPPCDLVIYNGVIKTDRIMICEIEDQEEINRQIIENVKAAKRKSALMSAIKNNYKDYYHWLPNNSLFIGGYVNFRSILTYSPEKLNEEFYEPEIRVQEYFIKSILNRFSAYYARQGQPDFNFDFEAEVIVEKISQTTAS